MQDTVGGQTMPTTTAKKTDQNPHSAGKDLNHFEMTPGGIEESIAESINESYNQSFRSNSAGDSRSRSATDKLSAAKHEALKANTSPVVSKGGKIDSSNSIAEMISDNYSEDFQQSSDHNQVESSRFSNSKKKLQDKARDLTQSAQYEHYSEDDFEESVAQSQH